MSCHTYCEVPNDSSSCHVVCEHAVVTLPSCAETCRDAPANDQPACIERCEHPPDFVCGNALARHQPNQVVTTVVLIGVMLALGGVAYVSLDYLSTAH